MRQFIIAAASAVALAGTAGMASAAAPNQQLSQAECQSIWQKADSSNSGSLTMTQAQPYVTDFKAVDTNSDGKLSRSEFDSACTQGKVHSTASSGAASGASGTAK